MPTYVACPHCFFPVHPERLQGRKVWTCPHCDEETAVSDDVTVDISPRRRRWQWVLGFLVVALLIAAAVAALR